MHCAWLAIRASLGLTCGALALACAKPQANSVAPRCASSSPRVADTHYDPILGCCGEGPWEKLREAQQQADFEAARLDAQNVDWSVYAHHTNAYLRGLSLLRLRASADTVSEAQLLRVAELLSDGGQLYSSHCAAMLTTCAQGQGIDMGRGSCLKNTKTVGMLADQVLAMVPPDRVVRAIVALYAKPGLAELTEVSVVTQRTRTRLRVAAVQAPLVLSETVAAHLPRAEAQARMRLLRALLSAPLGAAAPGSIQMLEPFLKSRERSEAQVAAAAILRLTDRDGSEASAADQEPRKSAVSILRRGFERNETHSLLVDLGPSASPLLDRILARMEEALAAPAYPGPGRYDLEMISAMERRAARATATLLQVLSRLARSTDSDRETQLGEVIRTLGAVSQPPEQWAPAVLGQVANRDLFVAATAGLRAAKAKLSAEQLNELKAKSRRYCTIPRHPRAFDGSWDDCFDAHADLDQLEKLSIGEPLQQSSVTDELQ